MPHNLIMLMIMMRKFPICWAPLCNDKSFAGNFECQFTLFDSSSHGEGGEGGENSPSCRCKLLLSTVWPEGGLFKLSVDKHAKSRRNRPCGLTIRMAMGSMLAGIEQDPP